VSESKVNVRHMKKRACVINTRYGEIQLDETGGVTNQEDLKVSTEDLLALPNFVDAKIFEPHPESAAAKRARTAEAAEPLKVSTPAGPSDEEYGDIIAELIDQGAACTGEGYIQMDELNAALREKDLPILSGTRRKDISDAYNANGE